MLDGGELKSAMDNWSSGFGALVISVEIFGCIVGVLEGLVMVVTWSGVSENREEGLQSEQVLQKEYFSV